MLANLLHVAGINHVITIDLHASQMQGFFKCPVDNLHAEPLIAKWIRRNVPTWKEAVCVSKNAGGTKRVTSLADALKLNFGMVTTDRKRGHTNMSSSMIMSRLDGYGHDDLDSDVSKLHIGNDETLTETEKPELRKINTDTDGSNASSPAKPHTTPPRHVHTRQDSYGSPRSAIPSPFRPAQGSASATHSPLIRNHSTPTLSSSIDEDGEYTDERARDITQGRLVQGHIVPDDYPSPSYSTMSSSMVLPNPDEDPMAMSTTSSYFNAEAADVLGGTADAAATSDEEEENFTNPRLEQMITLVGDVRNRTVFIVDDMIDKSGSWIAAAETVVKRGHAKKVYIIATHGLFGGDSLEDLQNCNCIDAIVVTNSFPIPDERVRANKKLIVLDLSGLLSEAIRRNHYGESISALFSHSYD